MTKINEKDRQQLRFFRRDRRDVYHETMFRCCAVVVDENSREQRQEVKHSL